MELRSTEEAKSNVEAFTERLVHLLNAKKDIDADIKALKQEFKEEGVPVGIVTKVVNKIKALAKKSNDEIYEEQTIQDWLESNTKIADSIGELNDV